MVCVKRYIGSRSCENDDRVVREDLRLGFSSWELISIFLFKAKHVRRFMLQLIVIMARTKSKVVTARNEGTSDKFGELPDHIFILMLCKLMCFREDDVMVQTRDIVKLMMVSKRWVNLFATMPYLRFSDENQDFPNIVNFIDNVLHRRDPLSAVHTFCVSWNHNVTYQGELSMKAWSSYVVARNIKILKFQVKVNESRNIRNELYYKQIRIPDCIFTCETLEELDLRVSCTDGWSAGGCLCYLESVQLSQLRTLRLHFVYDDDSSLDYLVSGCPVLEELELMNCYFIRLSITSDTLRHLTLANATVSEELQISCPNLQSLTFDVFSLTGLHIHFENVLYLTDAKIDIDKLSSFFMEPDEAHPEFISYGAKRGSKYSRLPIFHNLKKLELVGRFIEESFLMVASFLESAPNLEVLILGRHDDHSEIRDYGCPHYKLQVIVGILEAEYVFELMEYFIASICGCY